MPCGHAFCNGCWLDYLRIKVRVSKEAERATRGEARRFSPARLRVVALHGLAAPHAGRALPPGAAAWRHSCAGALTHATCPQIGDGQSRRVTCMAVKCGAICDDALVARLVASEPELVARCVC